MEELRKIIVEKSGITDEQASIAIETIATYIKDRTPVAIHAQLDKILAGNSLEESIRKEIETIGKMIREKADGLEEDLRSAFENVFRRKKK